jgi:hypothetical protein
VPVGKVPEILRICVSSSRRDTWICSTQRHNTRPHIYVKPHYEAVFPALKGWSWW